eukprot:6346592-Amphidinium_carterae.1
MQQARKGQEYGVSFQPLTCNEVLRLVLKKDTIEKLPNYRQLLFSKKTSYSETQDAQMTVSPAVLSIPESMKMLSIAETSGGEGGNLSKADWAKFVNLDQISSVVLHSERMLTQVDETHELPSQMAMGTWCRIHGPR